MISTVQQSVKTFQTNCELNTIPMFITMKIQYSKSIENKLNLKGGMLYV
jgi:hypothetical protein